mgnify:CR=1 FL=1
MAGLPAGLAIFMGVGAALARALWSASPWRVLALAFGLGVAELARGHLLTGFPWNALGHVVASSDVGLQMAALVGIHGMGFLAVFLAAVPVTVLVAGWRGARGPLVVAIGLVVAIAAHGAWRLSTPTGFVEGVALRIVQPNLTQSERLDPANAPAIVDRLFELTERPSPLDRPTTLIVWPESTLPFLLSNDTGVLPRIARTLTPGQILIMGAARAERTGPAPRDIAVYNSLHVFDHRARLLDRYDKLHLVPFGEYLPFEGLLSAIGLEALTRRGYTAGVTRQPIALPGAPSFIPAICYEIIFPGTLGQADGQRPGFIVNISDDSWFGDTAGPRQHLLQARVRAVEEGLPVVRGTTTGVSAVIDAHGRVIAALPMGARDVLPADLPTAIVPPPFSSNAAGITVAAPLLFLLLAFATRGGLGRGQQLNRAAFAARERGVALS